jgi:hypothetical protein
LIERGEDNPISTLQATLDAQLQKAFENNELSSEDAGQVTALFNSLFIL